MLNSFQQTKKNTKKQKKYKIKVLNVLKKVSFILKVIIYINDNLSINSRVSTNFMRN